MRLHSRMLLVTGLFFWGGIVFAQRAPSQTPPPAVGGKKAIVSPQPLGVTRAEEPQKAPTTETAPQPVGFEGDIYCFGYVGDLSVSRGPRTWWSRPTSSPTISCTFPAAWTRA